MGGGDICYGVWNRRDDCPVDSPVHAEYHHRGMAMAKVKGVMLMAGEIQSPFVMARGTYPLKTRQIAKLRIFAN
jgi:hypothetical protein